MEPHEEPYRNVSLIKAALFFLFRKKAFTDLAVSHDVSQCVTKNKDLRNRFVGERLDQYKTEIRENYAKRYPILRGAFVTAGLLVFFSALFGLAAGYVLKASLGPVPSFVNSGFQIIGAGLILWVTIWQLDVEVQTMGGETLLERVHSWLFRALYSVGTILFFVAYTWAV